MRISAEILQTLRCPNTKSELILKDDELESTTVPGFKYPIINGIPVLISNEKSLFSIEDFQNHNNTTFNLKTNKFRSIVIKYMPKISHNLKAKKNYKEIINILPAHAKILVIGGSIMGQGMEDFYANSSLEIVGADVSFGPFTKLICDAHDLPFEDDVFDCVIVQAVLEHVLDPARCVEEIYRVLKSSGLVYAETPFMQQVHMKQYDFTRYTHLGHRRLFRKFEEINSGSCGGPGMALAWSYTWFLRSFATSSFMINVMTVFGYLTSFYWKYFDYIIIDKPGGYDASSGFFFLGKKSTRLLTDKELISEFRGIK